MHIVNFKTKLKGRLMEVVFPKKRTIILRGSNAVDILYRIEGLLSNDYTAYYMDADKAYGFNYEAFDGESLLSLDTGLIIGNNLTVQTKGKIPSIHCIRYLGDGIFRSFLNLKEKKSDLLNYDMTKYTPAINDTIWFHIIETTNSYIGKRIVDLDNGTLRFDFDTENVLSIEAQKFVYMIIAECHLTPKGYQRVLLFSDIDILPSEYEVKLFNYLANISGHNICLTSADVDYKDIKSSEISFLNV